MQIEPCIQASEVAANLVDIIIWVFEFSLRVQLMCVDLPNKLLVISSAAE